MLSATSEYAVWALVALARRGRTMLARELAEEIDVPLSYLAKILTTLRRAGVLESTRGAKGGYRLARDPDSIPLIEVVRLLELLKDEGECLLGGGRCDSERPCDVHEAWRGVWAAHVRFLETYTIGALAAAATRRARTEVGAP